ncbi:MAG: peptidoglycan-binding protein [Parcubacteria group bacterium]|nr:peptidoglycan-binding protein [Parcubacteria group bacterium]
MRNKTRVKFICITLLLLLFFSAIPLVYAESSVFQSYLKRGSSGNEVARLQQVLKTMPEIYPEGLVSGYFGALTEKAVKKLQAKYGIEQIGVVGPKTRARLNESNVSSPKQMNAASSKSFSCPDEIRMREGLQTLAITNGISRPLAKDEQDWIMANCPATQGTKGNDFTYNQPVTEKLSSCVGNILLTDSPIDVSMVNRLIPLGHIGTPHHAIPMDHMEYLLPQMGEGAGRPILTDIKAPGAVHIIGVRQTIKKVNGVIVDDKYYSIGFTPCKEVLFYFEAMGTISDALKQAVQNAKNTELVASDMEGNQETVLKSYRIDYITKPGEIIGTAGGPDYPGATLDWGVYDFRIPKLGFLGEQFDNRLQYTTCPIDYFPSPLKEQLYEKFDREVPPRCGEVMQDKAGTIQGNWKAQGQPDSLNDLILMGIVHNNTDPSIGVIGVAGVIANHGSIDFTPQYKGLVNREPSEVKADGQIYCYQSGSHQQVSSAKPISGRILMQLQNNQTLKIEHQEISCSENLIFNSPTVYKR